MALFRLNIRVDRDTKRELERIAKAEQRTLQTICLRALQREIAAGKKAA